MALLGDRCGAEGQEPHHGAHLEARGAAVGEAEQVVVEPVLLVPHAVRARTVHGGGDVVEVLDELHDHVLVGRVLGRDLRGELQHVLAEERHPRRAVRLLQVAAGGERRAPVEDADVVEAEEAPLEHVLAEAVLPVHPPGEVEEELVEGRSEELHVGGPAQDLLGVVEEEGREGVDRRVHVAEVPLVGRHLPAGVQVHAPEHELHLVLREVGIHDRERERVEGQVPGRVPRVFPLVGHRDDVLVHHVEPLPVPELLAPVLEGARVVLLQPLVPVEEVELLGPEHAGERLSHHRGRVGGDRGWGHRAVERVRLGLPRAERLLELRTERSCRFRCRREAEAHGGRAAGGNVQPVMGRDLGAPPIGVHPVGAPQHHAVVDPVLHVRAGARLSGEEQLVVGLVLGEEEGDVALAVEHVLAQLAVRRRDRSRPRRALDLPQRGLVRRLGDPGRPVVPEPERGQEVQRRGLRSTVRRRDLHEEVVGPALGVLHEDVEVPVAVERAGVEELVLHLLPGAAPVHLHEIAVGEGALRVLVQVLHVRMGRGAVEVEVDLLHVLAVVSLAVGEAEEPLLEDGVLPVPEGEREAEVLAIVGDAGQAVLSPAVGARPGLVVREVVPGVAALAVVLPDRPPLPLAEVRAPLLPGSAPLPCVVEPCLLGVGGRFGGLRGGLPGHRVPPGVFGEFCAPWPILRH